MGKLLKPLVVILLLVNAGAAYLGYMVFEQREAIKAATLLQSKALADVAVNLDDEEIASDARKNLKVDLSDPAAIAPALEQITNLATIKQQNIVELQGDLAAEKTLRQQKEKELELTKADLESTRGDLEEAESNLAQTKTQLADAEAKVGGLNAEIADLKSNVDSLEDQLKDSEGNVADLNAEVADLKKRNDDLWAQTPEGRAAKAPTTDEIRKLTGTVIAARPDFNFLVMDLGSEKGLQSNLEALVHRDKKLIARVKITRVDDDFAIADILPDWRLGDVSLGDKVMFDIQ